MLFREKHVAVRVLPGLLHVDIELRYKPSLLCRRVAELRDGEDTNADPASHAISNMPSKPTLSRHAVVGFSKGKDYSLRPCPPGWTAVHILYPGDLSLPKSN